LLEFLQSLDSLSSIVLGNALIDGQEIIVKLLLETGEVDIDSKDNGGQTSLSWAARNGYEAVVKLICKHVN
jgi:ankyrin repeat protein